MVGGSAGALGTVATDFVGSSGSEMTRTRVSASGGSSGTAATITTSSAGGAKTAWRPRGDAGPDAAEGGFLAPAVEAPGVRGGFRPRRFLVHLGSVLYGSVRIFRLHGLHPRSKRSASTPRGYRGP